MKAEKTILILGAGRSSSSLIQALLEKAQSSEWKVAVGDMDVEMARSKCYGHPCAEWFEIDSKNPTDRNDRIAKADLVISMVPAFLHPEIASLAIEAGVPVITPSYVGPEMQALHERACEKGVLVLNEIGLDPGIDHLSAAQILDRIRKDGGNIKAFESYCGGLIAPDSDDNPWHYKFSWNPRNVILAGQAGAATFLEGGKHCLIPPHRVFKDARSIEVAGIPYEGYPNRDSIAYEEKYGLKGVETLIRGTLRGDGYCSSWDVLVQLGCVRDDAEMQWAEGVSWAVWMRSFLPSRAAELSLRDAIQSVTDASEACLDRLEWLGLMRDDIGPVRFSGTPAQIIQDLLEDKWRLQPTDRDLVVMWHRFEYEQNGQTHEITSSLVLEGRDATYTAMSDTVGWPMALAAEAILKGEFKRVGVEVPLHRDYYDILMPRLEAMGVHFNEEHRSW